MQDSHSQQHGPKRGSAPKEMPKRVVSAGANDIQASKRRKSEDSSIKNSSTRASTGFSPINKTQGAQTTSPATLVASEADPLVLRDSSRPTATLSHPRTRHRDPLVKDYLGLGSKVTETSGAFASVASSPEQQIANAVITAGKLSSLVNASTKSKPKDPMRVSKARRQSTAPKVQIDKQSSLAYHDNGMRPGSDSGSSDILSSSTLKVDSFTCSAQGPEGNGRRDNLAVVAPLTTMDSLLNQQSLECTLYSSSIESLASVSLGMMPFAANCALPQRVPATGAALDRHASCQPQLDALKSERAPQTRPRQASSSVTMSEDIDTGVSIMPTQTLVMKSQASGSLERGCDATTQHGADLDDLTCVSDFTDVDIRDEDFEQLRLRKCPSSSAHNSTWTPIAMADFVDNKLTPVRTAASQPECDPRQDSSPHLGSDLQELMPDAVDEDDMLQLVYDLDVQYKQEDHVSSVSQGKALKVNSVISAVPATMTTIRHAETVNRQHTACNDGGAILRPIVRPPFPKAIRDRSPIVGANATDSLRVCFRIGEALNVGAQAVRNGTNILLELYARVECSHREARNTKQYFEFVDLWARKGPSLIGVYERRNGSGLSDADLSTLDSTEGSKKMCRCIGRMKREDGQWKLMVLNIWEADWDDIEYVRGIIAA